MYTQTIDDMRKKLWLATTCLGVLMAGCTDSNSLAYSEESLVVKAAIEGFSGLATTRAAADNDYDRSSFLSGDMIRIVRTKSGTGNALNYTLGSDGKWNPSDASNYFRFESAATYQASYPSNYTSIRPDQTLKENYRLSNLLQTPAVSVSRFGVVDFTNDNGANGAFVHQNVKLTLNFVSNNALSFRSVTVQAPGLYTGGSAMETVYFLRPDASAYTWLAIAYPKGSATPISIFFVDSNDVTYKVSLSCPLIAGNNYIYTLTIRNNILIAVGSEIKAWQDESTYIGNFN